MNKTNKKFKDPGSAIINIHAESSSNISRRMEIYILMHLKPGTRNQEPGTREPGN